MASSQTVCTKCQNAKFSDRFRMFQNMEHLRANLELKRLRGGTDTADERRHLRLEIETLKKNLDSSSVHLVALKHQLSKTQVHNHQNYAK